LAKSYNGLLREHASLLNLVLRLLDMGLIAACGYIAFFFSNAVDFYASIGQPGFPESYGYVLVLAMLLGAVLFPMCHVYKAWRGSSLMEELRALSLAWVLVAFVLAMFALLTKSGQEFSRTWMGGWFLMTWGGFILSRITLRAGLRSHPTHVGLRAEVRRLGERRRPVIGWLPRGHLVNRYLGLIRARLSPGTIRRATAV